jgi:hypothetical protein
MEGIFRKQIIMLNTGEKYTVFHNHVAKLLCVHINFQHYVDKMFCTLGTTHQKAIVHFPLSQDFMDVL